MFNKYYQDELSYLRDMGREFAAKYPALAPFLAGKGSDPDVEMLLEGFAFLTAQIRQKLEDELPELTHSLLNLLFPHYLRPIPSMAILRFEPNFQRIRSTQHIKASARVESQPVDGTRCKYQTCHETIVHPIVIKNVAVIITTPVPLLVISFQTANNTPLGRLDIKSITAYLHGEPQWELYLLLFNYLKKIRVQNGDMGFELSPRSLKPVGFSEKE